MQLVDYIDYFQTIMAMVEKMKAMELNFEIIIVGYRLYKIDNDFQV